MKPCRLIKVKSLRMQALKAFAPDSANLQSSNNHHATSLSLSGPCMGRILYSVTTDMPTL